jgi:glycosyltransferase involved in cell wall biosynthesis
VKKKIVLFIDSLLAGGSQRQLVMLARELYKLQYEVSVLTYRGEEQLRYGLDEFCINHITIEKTVAFDPIFIYRLYRFLKKQGPDYLISYLNTPNLWARIAGVMAGVGTIITSERNNDIDKSMLRVLLEKILYRYSKKIVVNARSIKKLLVEIGIPKTKIEIIYNGVDTTYFSECSETEVKKFRDAINVDAEDLLITLPGRMTPQKNHMCLLEAMSKIKELPNNVKILFVGNEFFQNIKRNLVLKTKDIGLEKKVHFYGQSNNMPLIYSASDIVVLPSTHEGMPNVILEAMSCSKPVIASDVSDNSILIENGVSGYLFQNNDSKDLADKIWKLIQVDSATLIEMGRKARQRIKESFSLEVFAHSHEKLLNL